MKKLFIILSVGLFIFQSNAQLKVYSTGVVETNDQTVIRSNSNHQTDGLDVIGTNTSLSNGTDLIWSCYYGSQPNNPGILTAQSTDGAYFSIRANGCVGIFN
ncbi:MAG: hypothetical protein WCG08_16355, partial [Paludibacter sp.]